VASLNSIHTGGCRKCALAIFDVREAYVGIETLLDSR